MELVTMGKVIVPARVENLRDLYLGGTRPASSGSGPCPGGPDALVDTGATLLSLPKRFIKQLGLKRTKTRTAKTPGGIFEFGIYEPVRYGSRPGLYGSGCRDPRRMPRAYRPDSPGMLDWVVDPVGQKLIGNPDHNGEQMIELF